MINPPKPDEGPKPTKKDLQLKYQVTDIHMDIQSSTFDRFIERALSVPCNPLRKYQVDFLTRIFMTLNQNKSYITKLMKRDISLITLGAPQKMLP